METIIIDGRKISKEILIKLEKKFKVLPFQPIFCDILVGENPVSKQYVQMKKNMAEKIGICFHEAFFPAEITTEDLINEIKKINKIPYMSGVIVQLPLPISLDQKIILNAIDSNLDVDCLGDEASEKFYQGDFSLGFPAALASVYLLDSLNLDLIHKKIVVLGQGKLVGKPVSALLKFRGLSPMILIKESLEKEKILQEADIIISGIGIGRYLTKEMIKEGVVLIDAGTSESDAGIVGDVDLESVKGKAGSVSPVPGGVGPMTIAMLFQNVLKVAQKIK